MMAGPITRQQKRKREEEEHLKEIESPEIKIKKVVKKRQPKKTTYKRRKRPTQPKVNKPETFKTLYTVEEKLGEGGCGSVFAGTRVSDGLEVAIKYIPRHEFQYFQSPDKSVSIPVEVTLLQLMSEPPDQHIVKLIQWFEEPERLIIIMERLNPCMDLFDFLETRGGSLSEDMAKFLMIQAMQAVIECNIRGVLHSDIKLENFLINPDTLRIKLIDFGCGDLITGREFNQFKGTLQYCPPEYILTNRYHATPATVWSLGVLMFRLVHGFYPFNTSSKIVNGHLPLHDNLSDEFCDLVRWCLQPNPNWRPDYVQMAQHPWLKIHI